MSKPENLLHFVDGKAYYGPMDEGEFDYINNCVNNYEKLVSALGHLVWEIESNSKTLPNDFMKQLNNNPHSTLNIAKELIRQLPERTKAV